MSEKKLFLLDAMALIFRAYYALNKTPRLNSKGLNTSAILGFANTLFEVIKNEKPTHIGVAFDTMTPTFRHIEFEAYKGHREETPSDIVVAIPYIKKIIEAFGIPILISEGFEADDIIGTLAKEGEKEGFQVFMMTSDKDFGQLVSDNIRVYRPARNGEKAEIWGISEVCNKFAIQKPEQLIDILGLWGDAVDNIPGIPGIGEVTAKKLIAQFGSIENMIEKADEIENEKIRAKVKEHAEQAILSKRLATIMLEVPIEIDFEALNYTGPKTEELKEIFDELEFRNLAKRVFTEISLNEPNTTIQEVKNITKIKTKNIGQIDMFDIFSDENIEEENDTVDFVQNETYKTINDTNHNYKLVSSNEEIDDLINKIKKAKHFTFDTETTGLDTVNADIVGLSIAINPFEAFYIPISENKKEAISQLLKFKTVFEDNEIEKTGQNMKFDINILYKYQIEVKGTLFDTMLAHYILEPEQRHNMSILSETLLGYKPVEIETLIGKKGKNQQNMRSVEIEKIKEYAAEDADITLQLRNVLKPKLNAANAWNLFTNIEMPLMPVLASMERSGVKIDTEALAIYSTQLKGEINIIENEIYKEAGVKFNIASPKQLGEILFDKLKIVDNAKLTKTKQYQTGEDVLVKMRDKHPIIESILEHRTLTKLKSTYIDSLPLLVNKETGRVHTSFNQAVTATGRLSSTNPNLQNIPIRTEKGREIRKAFVPTNSDYVIVSADYSQIELRLIAELSKDENMLEAFRNSIDIHTSTASKVFGVPLEEVTKEMRRNAKAVNFGIVYGISAFGLSEQLGCGRKQAAQWIEEYFNQFSGIKSYIENQIHFARQNGYVETIFNRRRYLRDINSGNGIVRSFAERNAVNAPIQGSAADLIKVAMIGIQKEIEKRKLKSIMIIQVHDELVFDVLKSELDEVTSLVKEIMVNAVKVSVPLEVEISSGNNWLEAH